jgi:antirestriction protein
MARIYVASLSDYNAGLMHGVWIELDGKDADDVQGEVNAMLRTSKYPNVRVPCPDCEHERDSQRCKPCKGTGTVPSAEEWAIHDHEVPGMDVGEWTPFADIVAHVEMVEEHGDAWIAYVDCVGTKYATAEGFEDAQAGSADTELEWCEQFLDDAGTLDAIPENLRSYFDTERYLRDMKLGGDVTFEEVDGTVYAFWNH